MVAIHAGTAVAADVIMAGSIVVTFVDDQNTFVYV